MEVIVMRPRLPAGKSLWDGYVVAIEKALDDQAEILKGRLEAPAKTWSNPPLFNITRSFLRRDIYTTDMKYVLVNNGTQRSGMTRPRGRVLHLPSRWVAKTRVYDLDANAGVREYTKGKNVFYSVPKSSIRARHFDVAVAHEFYAPQNPKLGVAAILDAVDYTIDQIMRYG